MSVKKKMKKIKPKADYVTRHMHRVERLQKLIGTLSRSAKNAPDAWGVEFRDAVDQLDDAASLLAELEIPAGYQPMTSRTHIAPGHLVMIRGAARREAYRAIVPKIDDGGVVTRLLRHEDQPCAYVRFGTLELGPCPLRYLTSTTEENDDEDEEDDE